MQNPAENSSYDEAVSEESGGVLDHSSQLWAFSIITQRTILAARRYTDSQTPAGIWQRRSWTAVHRQLGVPKSRQHLQIQMCTFREQEWAALWSCCSPRRVYFHASHNHFCLSSHCSTQFLVHLNLPKRTPPYLPNHGQNVSPSGREKCWSTAEIPSPM